jgi:uncharacterized protein (DUF1778 family)
MPRRTIPGTGKKMPLNMRTTADLRKKIEAAAGASGRSMVQEVEYRVEASFHEDNLEDIRAELEAICRLLVQLSCEGEDNTRLLRLALKKNGAHAHG